MTTQHQHIVSRRAFLGLGALISAQLVSGCSSSGGSAALSSDPGLDMIRSRGQLRAGVKTDVPGYGFQDPATGSYQGMEIDLCYYLAARIFDVSFEEAHDKNLVSFTGVTAKTRGPLVDSGEVDCVIATYTITEERKKSWNFSEPYFSDSIGMLILKSSGLKTIKDLDNRIVGVGQGANTRKLMQKMLEDQGLGHYKVSYPQYLDYPTLAAALASGNIDVFALDRSILRGYMNASNELLQPDLHFGTQNYGICTNINAQEITQLAQDMVVSMKTDGSLTKLAEQYQLV